ncbi:MAG: NAD kinase [Paracoccaceae bacterium]
MTDAKTRNIHFTASDAPAAQQALADLSTRYGQVELDAADVIVALGGDGFMLQTLHRTQHLKTPTYGINCGTIGFLLNEFNDKNLPDRLSQAQEELINPLQMTAQDCDGVTHTALALNEVSLLRAGPQAAKLRISVDGKVRMDELICDGALVCTPAGSTAYNYSADGPILPIGSDVLALTAIAPFRPRRWRGALLPQSAKVRFDVLQAEKRPVMADADSRPVHNVKWVEISVNNDVVHRILFDPGQGLQERMMREQFV